MTNNIIYAIINILLYKYIYNKYYKYIYKYNIQHRELKNVLDLIKVLYETHPGKDEFTVDDLEVFFQSQHSGLSEKQAEVYNDIFKSLREAKADPKLVEDTLYAFRRQQVLSEISNDVWDVLGGTKELAEIHSKLAELEEPLLDDDDEAFVEGTLEDLLDSQVKQRGLRWRLDFLNMSLGSLRKGDFGFLFARPETGKTTFLASEASFMAEQLSEDSGPILWFNNEEQGKKVVLRAFQASLGKTIPELQTDVTAFQAEYLRRTHGKLKIVDRAALHKREVETFCKKYGPSLIIFDQIDKIKGFDADREDLRLGTIYTWARELAKEYCPVIGVCQADGTAEGVKWLTMDHVANAKTAKQAEADWILGIGKTHDRAMEDVRYLNISKNKLMGDDDSIPRLRHGQQEVLIEPTVARYRGI